MSLYGVIVLASNFVMLVFSPAVSGAGVFNIRHKFAGRKNDISEMKAHDVQRHGRMLGGVDFPLGGSSSPTGAGIYYTEIAIGNPPKTYYVQVDTGSDLLWVNCIQCQHCSNKSSLGIELSLYDPSSSSSGALVTCRDDFCAMYYQGHVSSCTTNIPCQYGLEYGDGSGSTGYFVEDFIHYNEVVGDLRTAPSNASIKFGCGYSQSGTLGGTDEKVDGIFGFGQSDISLLSQLSSAGRVKKMFSHCLAKNKGGGIFAIGHLVEPKLKTTPLVANESHYNVNMKAVDVGGTMLQLSSTALDSGMNQGTIIDSGTTLTYLAESIFNPLLKAIMSSGPSVQYQSVEGSSCFKYSGSVDDAFPTVTFYFENSLLLKVYPHQYIFPISDSQWCIGFQSSGAQTKEGKDITVFGDLVLTELLVYYDNENQSIGWTKYNCSSSIKVKDDKTGSVYSVGSHNISYSSLPNSPSAPILLMLLLLTGVINSWMF